MSFFFSSGIAKSVKTGMFTLDTGHSCFPKRITVQEANAIAKLNIENCEFEYIDSCGFEDYSKVKVDIVKDKKYDAKT